MHATVMSARAAGAELDQFLEKTEERLKLLLKARRLMRERAELLRQVAEIDADLAADAKAIRHALAEARKRE
ncbi:MAG TPA: hypothetical protein VFA39_18925 [Steroidobacteraceae bacterium]|nr:hypothetical protein [Steroidobacteraceae bacterium]